MEAALPELPVRPKRSDKSKGMKSIELASNHFKVKLQKKEAKIYLYAMSIEPEIPAEQRRRVATIVNRCRADITKSIGEGILFRAIHSLWQSAVF